VIDAFVVAAEQMLVDDVAANCAICADGAAAILKAASRKEKLRVMTHCNTGR
jgi:methylthioribose-1-phosphate isomerase